MTQSPNSQLPSIGLINNSLSAIDLQSRVEAPRPQVHRPLTLRVDKKSTHARRGGDHCGVNLHVRGESRPRQMREAELVKAAAAARVSIIGSSRLPAFENFTNE